MKEPVVSSIGHDHSSDAQTEAQEAVSAIWSYVTSVKSIRRLDGRIDDFHPEKIERSLCSAFQASGLLAEPAKESARAMTEELVKRLTQTHNGHSIPNTTDVHDLMLILLMEHGCEDAARQCIAFRHGIPTQEHTRLHPSLSPSMNDVHPIPAPLPVMESDHSPRRHRLNDERKAITHKFQVGTYEGYLTVGLYDETRQPGEIFLTMSKEGNAMSGLVDAFATAISIGLQYGVPLKVFVNKFADMRFEPSGATQNPNIPTAKSLIDYIFRWLALKFLSPEERQAIFMPGEISFAPPTLDRQSKLLDPSSLEGNLH